MIRAYFWGFYPIKYGKHCEFRQKHATLRYDRNIAQVGGLQYDIALYGRWDLRQRGVEIV